MPTSVGKQKTEAGVLSAAVQLEMDCVAAYSEAAKSLKDPGLADNFETMESDCQRHISAWQGRLADLNQPAAARNGLSEPLNRFKMKLARVFGLGAMHRAVQNNPADCATAYGRVAARTDLSAPTRALAESFAPDAKQHKRWVEELVERGSPAHQHAAHRG